MGPHLRSPLATAIAALAACCWLPAQAGTIYKCTEGGRTAYGDRPCASGRASELAVQAAPPPDPELAARLQRQRALAQDIDARRAAQAASDERDARDAARRQERQAHERRRQCERLRLQHEAAAEGEQRALARARGAHRAREQSRARDNERKRAGIMAEQCPA